jgi:hypothetical protein
MFVEEIKLIDREFEDTAIPFHISKVLSIRRQLQEGSYPFDARLDEVVDILLFDLRN